MMLILTQNEEEAKVIVDLFYLCTNRPRRVQYLAKEKDI